MKKRFTAVFLALALCLGLCVPVFAAGKTTYHLNFSQITTAERSEVSITGEGLEQTGEIFAEYGLGAGQDEAPRDYYPVFTSSKPVTITVTADYTDWRHTGTDRESGDNYNYISYAAVAGVSYNPVTNECVRIKEHAAYFDGTYAAIMYDDGIKENAGTLRDYYMNSPDDVAAIYIYSGATVTLSEPGDYLVSVTSNDLWSSRANDAVIRIVADDSQAAFPSSAFTDVSDGAWYANAVNWAVSKDITNGTGDGKFSPTQTCTHAQILTFLYRADRGQGKAEAADMDKAVAWAREKGMIDNSFNGKAFCTRADAVNYIWQALGRENAAASGFTDVPAGAGYATAVDWAVSNGITNGTNAAQTEFSPGKVCDRGTIVTFLHRAYVPSARLTPN